MSPAAHGSRTRSRKVATEGRTGSAYQRPYVCSVQGCGKAFTRSEHLRRHQLNHNPAKKTCPECSASFARDDLLQRHLKLSHAHRHASVLDASVPPQLARDVTEASFSHGNLLAGAVRSSAGDGTTEDSGLADITVPYFDDGSVHHGPHLLRGPWNQSADLWSYQEPDELDSSLNDIDIGWFWQNQTSAVGVGGEVEARLEPARPVSLIHTFPQERDKDGNYPPPRYLQEAASKVFIAHPGNIPAPNCGFPICNALAHDRRTELLMDLRDIMDFDIRDPIYSLNSMRQGIHLWLRDISTEYNFIHRELLLLRGPGEITDAVVDVLGEPPGAQLVWSTISFGWALMTSDDDREFHTASKIQRALRASVLTHPRLTDRPPIWLVQTLFMLLLFVRYQGTTAEYGGASMFHGALVEAVLRLDDSVRESSGLSGASDSTLHKWIRWVYREEVRRLRMQTFVMDVKNALLFGGESTIAFKDVTNIRFPTDLDRAWHAQTVEEWEAAVTIHEKNEAPASFSALLQDLWRPTQSASSRSTFLSGSISIMYGILAIAREVTRREDSILAQKPNHSMASLSATVDQALSLWEGTWRESCANDDLPWMVPTCTCLLQLARSTLYDVSTVDLQIVAGRCVVEGKPKGPADYARALRKIRAWAREERGRHGVARAANVICSRLCAETVEKHCHHCLWCLYLASLICWNYEFATTKTIRTVDFVQQGKLTCIEEAEKHCQAYLAAATMPSTAFYTASRTSQELPSTIGMLVIVTQYLEQSFNMGMIQEGIDLLQRLSGITPRPSPPASTERA